MKVFCMSDIHGCLKEFEDALSLILADLKKDDNKLVLLGDYIHGGKDSREVLDRIIALQKQYGKDKIIALLGNHEELVLDGISSINCEVGTVSEYDTKYIKWFKTLPRYYVLDKTIFVHAGIDETAGSDWELGTADEIFTMKYPASIGRVKGIDKKIVAGHISTASITGICSYNNILYDGGSHYYIDGNVMISHKIPILMIEDDMYYEVYKSGTLVVKAN